MLKENIVNQTALSKNLPIRAEKIVNQSGTLRKISAIARNTFREAVRDRVLYNLVLFVLLITAAAIFLGELTAGQEARVIVNFGLSAMLLFGAFISIFVGIGLVSKEIEKRTVFAIFAKPIGRGEFLVGKYFGLCLTLAANVAVMSAGLLLALVYVGGSSLAVSVLSAVFLIFLELTILTAVAILFSSFSSPALSALFTFFVFVIGHSSAALKDMANHLGTASAQFFFGALYYVLPNLSHFSFITAAANGKTPAFNQLIGGAAYAVVYVSILLAASVLIFNRRNFK
jgi:ABC-type transport system involved in multi-copper enzyme maturation permease subunit